MVNISEAGVECFQGNQKKRLKACHYNGQYLSPDLRNIELPPGTQREFFVYIDFSNPLKIPNVTNCYVIDQINKKRTGKHINNINLTPPIIHADWIE